MIYGSKVAIKIQLRFYGSAVLQKNVTLLGRRSLDFGQETEQCQLEVNFHSFLVDFEVPIAIRVLHCIVLMLHYEPLCILGQSGLGDSVDSCHANASENLFIQIHVSILV